MDNIFIRNYLLSHILRWLEITNDHFFRPLHDRTNASVQPKLALDRHVTSIPFNLGLSYISCHLMYRMHLELTRFILYKLRIAIWDPSLYWHFNNFVPKWVSSAQGDRGPQTGFHSQGGVRFYPWKPTRGNRHTEPEGTGRVHEQWTQGSLRSQGGLEGGYGTLS